jgi:5-methyltetrahydrofolate--homocysteine methyltransferase
LAGSAATKDYAKRKQLPVAEAERWLASNLDYDPNEITQQGAAA